MRLVAPAFPLTHITWTLTTTMATPALCITSSATASQSVLFQGDIPMTVKKQIVRFSDFHLKEVNFARTTGQQLALREASVFLPW